ncbi:PREDICTED: protein FAM83B [Cyprinodon variegatus]|uniref:Family with sequence similarity 83 member B n=1 Tax=Cyprinodon variegatus TaxID=28743 RepID=A0A3Q2DD83_CYPVA|nr:PREDICTED: protein FAM83B [Cyprinodon variegatus]
MEVGYFTSIREDFHKGHYQNVLKQQPEEMDYPEFSLLSSLRAEFKHEDFVQPHYKETYRLAVDCLVKDGRDSYDEFLKGEHVGNFLSEDEILFITSNAKQLLSENKTEEVIGPPDNQSSSGTYWPTESDVETPNLDLGWPEVLHKRSPTNINLLHHPPRLNNPTIKEVIRKNIQDAKQVIAIVMDKFTDVDIFKEAVDASIRGVPVYVLLDEYHVKSFLKMADDQDIKIKQLRNMRVRTVKGQGYLCRSGAKFHGAMEQKFLLVDCHTAIYGSYSFTWSFEKINLSMVQVITGQLVQSYDEEFRTLYARSVVPPELETSLVGPHNNGVQGQKMLPRYSIPSTDRMDRLRYSLDVVNNKNFERQSGTRVFKDRYLEEENKTRGPLIKVPLLELESLDQMNLLKRHSYAGERQDECIPESIRLRGINGNSSRNGGILSKNYSMDNYMQVQQIHRDQNMYQSYSGIDKQVLSMQQNMPTLENTSKLFLRTWRIDSYLKNPDAPFPDTCDYLDQLEMDNGSSFMQGHMRNSFALRCPTKEQIEPSRLINPSCLSDFSTTPYTPLHHNSMHWNPDANVENRNVSNEFILNRKSPQLLDNYDNTAHYSPGRNIYQSTYSSLSRNKHARIITNPDMLANSWHKRHSVADPRSSTENTYETSEHMYGRFVKTEVNCSTVEIPDQHRGYRSNINKDQRSLSQYDVKNINDKNGPSTGAWHELPSRTVSTAALHLNSKNLGNKSSSINSQCSTKSSSKNVQSLSNITERKNDFFRTIETPSLHSGDSCDTLTAEDGATTSGGENASQTAASSDKSSSESHLKTSKPQFETEEHRDKPVISASKAATQKKPSIPGKNTKPATESRMHSRFEPFSSLEKKPSFLRASRRSQAQEKTRSLSGGEAAVEPSHTQATRGHQENKLERFFHRVGNLLHKNK